ncbi:hypothetical protein QJS10_CPA16g01630 [Acorus calamus]|uniref:DUF7731 domain-containing protein n=1 Tax=Acorus calamus TaxID=4465 RepID=A0AAV9D1A7_ACOCL|nr:hypothetical protein QJS10_CPA16g01630 [Acorus calamus]
MSFSVAYKLLILSLFLPLMFISGFTSAENENPANIFSKAFRCLDDQNVYSRCQEDYRINVAGNINVPYDETDTYCSGPCLIETKLVLDCIDGIMSNFLFYNSATTKNIRSTLRSGCSHTNRRGNFNVAENLEEESNGGDKKFKPIYYAWVSLFLGLLML